MMPRPPRMSVRAPSRPMTFDATVAAKVMAAASGRNSRPAANADAPVMACRYSEDRKIAPTTTPVTPAITAGVEISERIRQVAGGTSGAVPRRSSRAKAAGGARLAVRAAADAGDLHPHRPDAAGTGRRGSGPGRRRAPRGPHRGRYPLAQARRTHEDLGARRT